MANWQGDVTLDLPAYEIDLLVFATAWPALRIETSIGVLVLFVAVIAGLAALAYRSWGAIARAPRGLERKIRDGRRQRGYKALTQGMVAVAAGEARGGAALLEAGRDPAERAALDPPAGGPGGPAGRRRGGRQALFRDHAGAPGDSLPGPARVAHAGPARGRGGGRPGLCQAGLRPAPQDPLGADQPGRAERAPGRLRGRRTGDHGGRETQGSAGRHGDPPARRGAARAGAGRARGRARGGGAQAGPRGAQAGPGPGPRRPPCWASCWPPRAAGARPARLWRRPGPGRPIPPSSRPMARAWKRATGSTS